MAVAVAPQAAPAVDEKIKCWRCQRVLCDYAARPWAFTCPRCKARNASPPEESR